MIPAVVFEQTKKYSSLYKLSDDRNFLNFSNDLVSFI